MKQKIDPSEIKPGDVIRWEAGESTHGPAHAVEYTAAKSCLPWRLSGQHYLLDRPEPPFEPYWGMVIGEPLDFPDDGGVKAVYVPTGDGYNWFSHPEPEGKEGIYYFEDDWAKRKLAEGWVIINKPEGVK